MGKSNKSFLLLLPLLIAMVLSYQNCGEMTSFGNGDPYEGLDTVDNGQIHIDDGPGLPPSSNVNEPGSTVKVCIPNTQDSLLSQLDITIKSGASVQDNIIIFNFYDPTGSQTTALSGTPQDKYILNYQFSDAILIETITVSEESVTINYVNPNGVNQTELFNCTTSSAP